MAERGLPDGAFMSLLIVVGLVAVDLIGAAGVAAPQGLGQNTAEHKVQHQTHRNGVQHLDDHQQHELIPVRRHRDQQRHRLVAGGDEHRDEGAQRDDAGGIKVRCNGRKAALRHTAQQRRRDSPPAAAAFQHGLDLLAVAVLDVFNEQIGQKQKGQHLGRIDQALAQNIQKQFHTGFSLHRNGASVL